MMRLIVSAVFAAALFSSDAKSATVTRDDLKQTLVHVQQLAREMHEELDAAATAKLELEAQIVKASTALADSKARADALQSQIDQMVQEQEAKLKAARVTLARAENEKARAEADREHILGKYHFLKLSGASLLAALVFLLIWRFSPPVVGSWAIAIYTVPPAAAFAAFFIIL